MTEERGTTVIEALAAVMGDVREVKKTDQNTHQRFMFRGIDATMNAVGPALRTHGVVVVPQVNEYLSETVAVGDNRRPMCRMVVKVTYRFYGPQGDWIDTTVLGESFDAGDKATPKAMSVAFRTALLQALCLPTDDPDPDAQSYERAAPDTVDDGYDGTRTQRHKGAPPGDDPWAGAPESFGGSPAMARQQDYKGGNPDAAATKKQLGMIGALFSERKIFDHTQRLTHVNDWIDQPVADATQLTRAQASHVIDQIKLIPNPDLDPNVDD